MSPLEWNGGKVFVTGMGNELGNLSTVRPMLGVSTETEDTKLSTRRPLYRRS